MRITRNLFNSVKSNEFNPCNLYFCKCVEYLYPNKKEKAYAPIVFISRKLKNYQIVMI